MFATRPLTLADFHELRIRRTGGLIGAEDVLHIDDAMRATVKSRHQGDHAFQLDEVLAQELLAALQRLVTENPAPVTDPHVTDPFTYDVELSYNGTTYRVHSADVGADDALHGVMYAANHLIDLDRSAPRGAMTMHHVAREEDPRPGELLWPPKNGNTGIVPPWLQREAGTPDD